VLRRTTSGEESAKVSILPGSTANTVEIQKVHLQKFERTIEGGELSADLFAQILDEVCNDLSIFNHVVGSNVRQATVHMGLPASGDHHREYSTKRFSDDVLCIELSGPDHQYLSVVDAPGLFHSQSEIFVVIELYKY